MAPTNIFVLFAIILVISTMAVAGQDEPTTADGLDGKFRRRRPYMMGGMGMGMMPYGMGGMGYGMGMGMGMGYGMGMGMYGFYGRKRRSMKV